jgi:bifunctional DNase/RNase
LDRNTRNPVVILKERDGQRILPIWIGPAEASAIAMHLAEMQFPRPLTHDLMASMLSGMGGALRKVVITQVVDDTYYAELFIHRNGEVISVDARPSDSVALALRTEAQIFADDSLLEYAQLEISHAGSPEDFEESEAGSGEEGPSLDADALNEYLRKLNPEDFGRFTP